jgi:hypothetical protein
MVSLLASVVTVMIGSMTMAQGISDMSDVTKTLFVLPDGVETRWASPENWKGAKGTAGQVNDGRKGSPSFLLKAGAAQVLAEVTGASGTVRRIWATINDRSPKMLRGIRLDMYWDGAEKAAVSVPLGDFFCHGLGRMATFQNALFSSPEGRSFNCCIPMPFRKGMKIVATNETDTDLPMFFYDINYTVGDQHPDNVLYFHSQFRREQQTTVQQDYELLSRVEGAGRFLGVNIGVIGDTDRYFGSWWGEGEVKVFLDGDRELPTLCGTGTEDYIGTGWGQGEYANLYQGCHVADHEQFQFCFYRLHMPDPVYFRKDIRVTIQQIGCWDPESKPKLDQSEEVYHLAGPGLEEIDFSESGGTPDYGLFERQDDWSSCAYFYLDTPTSNLPDLAPLAERVAGL